MERQKNILLLTGSPRPKGNSNLLAQSFVDGAKKRGHAVTIFDTVKKKVHGCRACDTCWSRGSACSFQNDHFNELADYLQKADVVVFATPLYWASFSGHLKNAIDKIYSFTVDAVPKPLENIESVLLSTGYDKQEAFDGLISQFKYINSYMDWSIHAILTVPHVHNIGDITATKALTQAYDIGYSL